MNQDEAKYEEYKLLLLLAEDSQYAFQMIYDRHRNRVYQTAVRYLKSPQLGQEVVQDVFLKLWFERHQLKQDTPLEAWIYTVARNNILNRVKKIAVEWKALKSLSHTQTSSDQSCSYKLENSEYDKLLVHAIAALPPQQKQVFELARKQKMSYAEIGRELKISPLTVKTHMSRALLQIRTILGRQGVEIPVILLASLFFF